MFDKECLPSAPSLIESMRSIGYSFSSAIADLIDNSISAKAKNIKILSYPSTNPSLIILDDGFGMDKHELYEAMRYGSKNPLDKRNNDDLGRFGLGLKSASLSQCRKLIVISKKDGEINGYSWDLDYVIEKSEWILKGFSENEINKFEDIDLLKNLEHGTYILLKEFDRVKESTSDISKTFTSKLNDMEEHISLVFHRFIQEDGLKIEINGREIEAKDPFLESNMSTQKKRETSFIVSGEKIFVKPYILPHISKLSDDELHKVGGKEKLKNDQGFYIYRNKRLIVWGTWFRLISKDELGKLARVRVDIPNSLDYMWSIDVKKSTAVLPDVIRKNMRNAVFESIDASTNVHTYRGRRKNKNKEISYIWEKLELRNGNYKYVINREMPQLKLLEGLLDKEQMNLLYTTLDLIEDSIPTSAIYVDMAQGNIEDINSVDNESQDILDDYWYQIDELIKISENMGINPKEIYLSCLSMEPYCSNKFIKEKILKELKKYE